jgi:hypothetical protein
MYVPIKCPILPAHNIFCISYGSSQWTDIILQQTYINPLKTKRRPLYLKTQSVPRSKHFSSRL